MKAIDTRILVQKKGTMEKEKIGNFEMPITEYETVEVLSVGEKIESVKPGDTALIYPGAGKEFMKDGQKFKVISVNEIIVIL
jgi:co-chaperonin GroES (HSP10)